MTSRSIRSTLAALLTGALLPLTVQAASFSEAQLKAAADLQDRIVTLDHHLDIPFDFGSGELDAGKDGPSQFDLVKAARGHLKGAVVAIFVPQNERTPEGYAAAAALGEKKLAAVQSVVAKYPERVAIAHSPEELEAIEKSGRFAIVLSILNGNLIGKDLSLLDVWYKRGVRMFGFTHAGNNDLADSSRPNLLRGNKLGEHGGLSPLGREAVGRLNDLGIIIDVSQITGEALAQVLELTRAPVVASHSNARAIINHPRNLSDEQLDAIRRNGGVVAINAYSSWVRPLPQEAVDKGNAVRRRYGVPEEPTVAGIQPLTEDGVKVLPEDEFKKYSDEFHAITGDPQYRATLEEYVDQIDYVVKKIGVDHVAISSDFNHGGGVIGWGDVGETANVTAELLRRGYSEADIAKLWGGNFQRVWKQVQALAKTPAKTPAEK
ncbi:dipeptidase [Pedomonas sp. V897]|uniref:dipeptidase n=1 Tax=Pedomonas sp. V897 TaxID=3446482 RepID=UPI003EDF864A